MHLRVLIACVGVVAVSAPAAAQRARSRPQFGGAIEWRSQIGTIPDSTDRRTGLAVRIIADGRWKPYVGWRFEGAYIQAQYDRAGAAGTTFGVNEDGYELGGFLRTTRPDSSSAKWIPYAIGGPILSLRGACSLDNGFGSDNEIRCTDANTVRFGWAAGAGIRMRGGLGGWDWFLEGRLLGNVTSASGGKLVALAFGASY
ncbi:MAG TPA: hypothetical protein VJR92_00590 [Gemmatimonadaceae bacterium]|nr:hypothetical protein [Gemmatimonadaceae bacterium]